MKTDRFYVTLSPSQARRRLKGHGFGVRKVGTAGKNRAVIFHTAKYEHLEQLVTLFRDVIEPWEEEIVRVLLETPNISDAEIMKRFEWLHLHDRTIAFARETAKLRSNNLPVPTPDWRLAYWFR